MSQFIVLGKNNSNYNLSNVSITLPDNYILFTKDNQIAGLPYPNFNNNILQWDPDSQVYFWNTLSLSTITGNKETSKGILWNDSNDKLHMMSETNGVYQITISNDKYTLTPAENNLINFNPLVQFDYILTRGMGNQINGIKPEQGYLYHDFYEGYYFKQYPETVSTPGLIYWNGSNYTAVTGKRGDGLYALNKTGSAVVNIASTNGFLIASNNSLTTLNYPVTSGEYTLINDQNGKLYWSKKELIVDKVIDVNINSGITDGETLLTVPYDGSYLITLNFTANVNVIKLPKFSKDFNSFINACPKLIFKTTNGQTLFTKIFTGPTSYDYFSYSLFKTLLAGDKIITYWENNDNIVSIIKTNVVLTYIENVNLDNYTSISGAEDYTGIHNVMSSGRYVVITNIEYLINNVVDIPKNSQITVNYGNNKCIIFAVPPVLSAIYSNTNVFTLRQGDLISIEVNNPYIQITNYNIILNKIS